jgi:hypothetical protein
MHQPPRLRYLSTQNSSLWDILPVDSGGGAYCARFGWFYPPLKRYRTTGWATIFLSQALEASFWENIFFQIHRQIFFVKKTLQIIFKVLYSVKMVGLNQNSSSQLHLKNIFLKKYASGVLWLKFVTMRVQYSHKSRRTPKNAPFAGNRSFRWLALGAGSSSAVPCQGHLLLY